MTGSIVFHVWLWLAIWLIPCRMAGQSHLNLLDSVGHYLNQGRFNDALTAANTAQRLQKPTNGITDSLSAKIHYWLGKCYLVLADKGQALAHFDTAWACVSNQESDLRYLIELQSGVLKPDKNRIRQAMHYFETTTTFDQQVLGEAYLAYASYLLQTTDNELVIKALHKARTLLQGVASGQSVLGKCIELTGFYWWRKEKEYERALEHFQQAEDIYKKNGGPGSNYLAALYINFGGCLDEMGYPRKAVELYKTAEINLQGQNIRHPLLLNLYNNLGNSLSDLGDFTPAIRYLEKAVELAPNEQKGRYWNNLGDVYIDQGNYAQAEKCFNQSIALFSRLEKPPPAQLARPYHNLAIVYRQRGALDSALQFEFRSLPLRKSDPRAFLDIARTFQGIGECYLAQQNYTSAARYLDSALLLQRRAIPGGRNAEIAGVCLSKARCMAGSGDLDAAMALCDSALIACGYDDGANFEAAIAPPELLSVLAFRGNLFTRYYQKSAQIAHLSAAELAFDTAAQAIRFFRNTLLESESRAVLAGQFRDILSEGVAASLALHRLEPASGIHLQRAFAYAEQSKALVLLEGVRSAGAVRFEGVSDSLLDLERRLRQEVTDAEVRLRKWWSRSGAASDSTIALAKNELFNRQRAFEHFQRSLASGDLARYYEFRYGFSLANPEEVQSQLLHPNKCLVSYFIENNQRVTAFVVQKEAVYAVECPGGQNLHALVDSLRNGLFGYYTLPRRKRTEELYAQTLHQYIPAAQNLYNLLLAPVESLLTEEVVIVPDGILGYVPFELLLTGPPPAQITNFTEYPYWFKSRRHRVSYSYSATLLREMSQKQHRIVPEKSLLAMAPFFPGARTELSQKPADPDQTRKGMNPLVYSGQEVRDIGQICESDNWWVGREATKSLFLREAPHCRLVHLSTHGVLDSAADFSYLGFAPETEGEEPAPLFVRDLYNLQLNADLVTLSACETGIGQLQSGEGIISLARAFAYAGAKSIVTSLWQVNDAATKDLMLLFYQELNRGKNKDQALHDAKLGYLQSTSGERSHPFFWAGLIGLGAMNPVALR